MSIFSRFNILKRVGDLEKASRVSSIEGRAFSESDKFRLERQFPLPYYNEIRYIAKRNTSLRTIIHVLQDKVFEQTPVFVPVFDKKCTLCGKEADADEDMCSCGGILREPAPEELTHMKEFFKNCNLNDQHFCSVLREFEDNLNIMDDAFLIVLKDYVFNDDNTVLLFEKVREILSVTPDFMDFDLDENLIQGNMHYTCVEHRQLLIEPGTCSDCGKPLYPVYFTYGEGNTKAMPYLKGEVIHNSRYSPSKTYGYSPIATVYEEAMIELNGNRLLNDTYMYQRPPKGILAIVTRNIESLQKFWKKEMDSVRTNPNHMPVMGIESETGRGKAEYISLMNSVADMDVLNVSEKMRESIAGLYRISPLYRGSTEGIGGLNAEDVQRSVTAEPVAAAQKGYHDEVFPKLLKMFGITDWKLEFPSPYPAGDDSDIDKRIKEVQIATQMHGMGFVVSLDENDEFVYSGESQQPQIGGGFGDDMMLSAQGKNPLLLSAGLTKGKKYIKNPKDAPPGANVQQGPKGGYYYEAIPPEAEEELEKDVPTKNYTVISNIKDLDGKPNIFFRVEAYGGADVDINEMRSVIGSDQIDNECEMCGAKMDMDDIKGGCPVCGAEATQENRYAKMIDDFDLKPNDEGDYELPGILAFDSYSDAEEYANNVPGGEIIAYNGDELYYGMQEPDTGADELLISLNKRYRNASNVLSINVHNITKSDDKLWRTIGKPLTKADPDILIYNERMSPVMIRRIIERDYVITPPMLKKLEAIAKSVKTDPLQVLWAIHRKAYIAGLGKANIEKTVNEYILRMTGNKKLLINIATITAFNEKNNLTEWKPKSPEKIAHEERAKVDEKAYPQYSGMTRTESAETNDIIFKGFEDGKSVDQIAKEIEGTTDVSFEDARVIVRSEESIISNNLRLKRYQDRDPNNEYRYIWEGPRDFRVTEICENIKRRIKKEGNGKGVPLKRLLAIVEEESIKGNPATWQYRSLLPHLQCRHSLVRVL